MFWLVVPRVVLYNNIYYSIETEITSYYYLENNVETLPMLVNCGSVEQLTLCGLQTVKDQMKLKRLFTALSVNTDMLSSAAASSSSSLMSGEHTKRRKKIENERIDTRS